MGLIIWFLQHSETCTEVIQAQKSRKQSFSVKIELPEGGHLHAHLFFSK